MKTAFPLPPCPALIIAFGLAVFLGAHLQRTAAQSPTVSIPELGQNLTNEQAANLSKLAIDGLHREYPNKPGNVVTSPETVLSPKQMHPAFYGCFDWHSSVHGHWMLVRLLKTNPTHSLADAARKGLATSLTTENILVEANYFNEKENKSFERMYGWAWLLRLAAELHTWEDSQGKQWRVALQPLEAKIVELAMIYLPKLKQPIRTGVHPDAAFALGQFLDYARIVGNQELEQLVVARANAYYAKDRDYNSEYEPSGEDFFSPSLNEADLMRRILPQAEFAQWLTAFLPDLKVNSKSKLLQPVIVSDVTDGKLVHLAGLDLSRAWCMQGIIQGLPSNDPRVGLLKRSAVEHAKIGLGYVFSGHYEGEHWLGTFAVYALTMK
jgi:hypothetical protein